MTTILRSAILILAVLGAASSASAQGAQVDTPQVVSAPVQEHRETRAGGASLFPAMSISVGPRRRVSFTAAASLHREPLPRESEMAGDGTRIRPRTTGILIGGVLGGAVGFAAGYQLDNVERTGGDRVGSISLVGTAGGVFVGALVGGVVGWLAER